MSRQRSRMVANQEDEVDEELRAFGCYEDDLDYYYKIQLLMALKNSQNLVDDEAKITEYTTQSALSTQVCSDFDDLSSNEQKDENIKTSNLLNVSKCGETQQKSPILKPKAPKILTNKQIVDAPLKNNLLISAVGIHNDGNRSMPSKICLANSLRDPLKSYVKPSDMSAEEFSVLLHEHLDLIEYQLWSHYCEQDTGDIHTIESGDVKDKNNLGYDCWDEIMAEVVRERTLKCELSHKRNVSHCDENADAVNVLDEEYHSLSGSSRSKRKTRNAFAQANKKICCINDDEKEAVAGSENNPLVLDNEKNELSSEIKHTVRKRFRTLKTYGAKVSKKESEGPSGKK